MMRLIPLFVVLSACSGGGAPESPKAEAPVEASKSPVEAAAAIADAIAADPSSADAVLEAHGMTEEAYRDLLYEIAGDAEKSKAFLAARK